MCAADARGEQSEIRHRCLREQDGAALDKACRRRCIERRRCATSVWRRAAVHRRSRNRDTVLDRDGDPIKRSQRRSAAPSFARPTRGSQRAFCIDVEEGVDRRVVPRRSLQNRLHHIKGRKVVPSIAARELGGRKRAEIRRQSIASRGGHREHFRGEELGIFEANVDFRKWSRNRAIGDIVRSEAEIVILWI